MKKIVVLLLVAGFTAFPNYGMDIAGVNVPGYLMTGKTRLVLNGAGIRRKLFINAYVAALYLTEKNSDSEKIINADEVMGIRLHMTTNVITGRVMADNTREGFKRSTGGNTVSIQDRIELFIAVFKDKVKENDIYDIIYAPGTGIKVFKNNRFVSAAPGLDFKKALFGIWLRDNVPFTDLRKGMLGL